MQMKFVGIGMALLGFILFATVGYGTQTIGSGGMSTDLHWGKIIGFGALILVGGLVTKFAESRE